jgi:hypothetical protein
MTALGNGHIKPISEVWVERITCINESLKKVMATHQEVWNYSLGTWHGHNQHLLNNWLEIVSLFYTQSLTTRERVSELLEAYLRSLQVVTIARDEKFFETAETLQSGVQSNSERVAKLFTPMKN